MGFFGGGGGGGFFNQVSRFFTGGGDMSMSRRSGGVRGPSVRIPQRTFGQQFVRKYGGGNPMADILAGDAADAASGGLLNGPANYTSPVQRAMSRRLISKSGGG